MSQIRDEWPFEVNAPTLVVNNLEEVIQEMHPTGAVREALADALSAARRLVEWLQFLNAARVRLTKEQTWTEFSNRKG